METSKLFVVALALIAVGCGRPSTTGKSDVASGTSGGGATAAGADAGNTFRMKLHTVMDSEGTGKQACTYLVPTDWQANDKLTWYPTNYLTPVIQRSIITSADGLTQIDMVSAMSITFGHGPGGSFGMNPPQSVSKFLIKGWKAEHAGVPFEVISEQDTKLGSGYFGAVGSPVAYATQGDVKLRFKKNGHAVIAKLRGRVDVGKTPETQTMIGGSMSEGSWLLTNGWTATAPEDKLEAAMRLLGVVMTSYREDPHFYNVVTQCQSIIQQNFYARQNAIMRTSQIISQTNDQISDSIMSSYNNQEAAQEHAVQGFDDYIRGVDRYNDEGTTVIVPNDYSHTWSDGAGNYILSDNSGFNPNETNITGSWHECPLQQ